MGSMQVMVLAAGFGERLKPLTERIPKPALPLFGETVLGRLVKALAAQGADRIVYNTHHLADEVAQAAEEACPPGVELLRSHEESIQGTAGALREASGLFRDEPLVVLNGDVIHDVDLPRLMAFHRARGAVATLVCRADPQTEAYGPLGLDGEGRVRRFLGWRAQNAEMGRLKTVMFTGIQVVEPEALGRIPGGVVSTTETLYPMLLREDEPVFGAVHEGYWMDIGTPARYLKAHRDLLRAKVGPPPKSDWHPSAVANISVKEPLWVVEDTIVEVRSVLGPYAVIGPRCRLGPGVVLERSVLMEGVEVGPRTILEGCIVGPGLRLAKEGNFSDQLITLDEDGGPQFTPIGPGGEAA
jgi:NDP-sugar pyrophosphorylase family protein